MPRLRILPEEVPGEEVSESTPGWRGRVSVAEGDDVD